MLDLVDLAFGDGRVHIYSLWDTVRYVVRANKMKFLDVTSIDIWIAEKQRKQSRLAAVPAGVRVSYVPVTELQDDNSEILICDNRDVDYRKLTSHCSGELTTLLFNSIQNKSTSDIALRDPFLNQPAILRSGRFVGDDRVEIYRSIKPNSLDDEEFDSFKEAMFRHVRESHVINP